MPKTPLILIPGFANTALAWKYQTEQLEKSFAVRVLVMNKFSTRQEMVEYLLENAPEQFILAGHSMGGWVAQAVAAAAPHRVTKLALLNTWASLSPAMLTLQRQLSDALKRGLLQKVMGDYLPLIVHPSRLQDPHLIGTLQKMVAQFSIQTLIDQLEAMLADPSSVPLHPRIKAPTLIISSDKDALFPDEMATLCTGIPHAEAVTIEGSGHASLLEKPEEVTDLLLSFANKHIKLF